MDFVLVLGGVAALALLLSSGSPPATTGAIVPVAPPTASPASPTASTVVSPSLPAGNTSPVVLVTPTTVPVLLAPTPPSNVIPDGVLVTINGEQQVFTNGNTTMDQSPDLNTNFPEDPMLENCLEHYGSIAEQFIPVSDQCAKYGFGN